MTIPGPPAEAARNLLAALAPDPPGGPLVHGDDRVLGCLDALSGLLLHPATARAHPELAPLGAFLRRASLVRELASRTLAGPSLLHPRGLVFHVPPANVDTLFAYAWALSALAGNSNVVRLPTRAGAPAQRLLGLVGRALSEAHPALAHTQHFTDYGHDEETTAVYSAACDLRVIWGGDATVTALRRHPLAPHARELTFPDRSSFAVFSVEGWLRASAAEQQRGAQGLHRDAMWFDQDACASPRTLFWVGDDPARLDEARSGLRSLLAELTPGAGSAHQDVPAAIHQRVSTYALAADGDVTRLRFTQGGLAFAELATDAPPNRDWLGSGTFPERTLGRLADLVPLIRRRDQTLTHFGLTERELTALAGDVGPYGVDRIVPVGDALAFGAVWDGYDLIREFSRITTVTLHPPHHPRGSSSESSQRNLT
ncbi:acyl-CoA reductase [Streptomyces sp. BE230]|uniref:acyl-CoA reductase n=1 Tax=Streptomyces sp. BE230 TaxID=3002526 RepID=UPI002ED5A4F5|nr:acyl-CoA reductase [Streptomyces sp. BE230]